MKVYQTEAGSGRHRICLVAMETGRGIMASLAGGEEPHLGGVVISVPRPSLSDPAITSCTTSVVPLVGHKDDEAARPLAEMLARETGQPVSMAAGIHVKKAGAEDIDLLKKNCQECGKKLLALIRGQEQ